MQFDSDFQTSSLFDPVFNTTDGTINMNRTGCYRLQ